MAVDARRQAEEGAEKRVVNVLVVVLPQLRDQRVTLVIEHIGAVTVARVPVAARADEPPFTAALVVAFGCLCGVKATHAAPRRAPYETLLRWVETMHPASCPAAPRNVWAA